MTAEFHDEITRLDALTKIIQTSLTEATKSLNISKLNIRSIRIKIDTLKRKVNYAKKNNKDKMEIPVDELSTEMSS